MLGKVRILFAVVGVLCLGQSAWARPEYARKEIKACQFCHVSGSPGATDAKSGAKEATTRNNRGKYYEAHNHTFDGYAEFAVMGKQSPPIFHASWKEVLTDAPRRIGVGDVTGDKNSRLITLNEIADKKDVSTLSIKKWDGKAFVTEFTQEVKAPADKLQVGRFAGNDKPAVILTGDGIWYWNGSKFDHKPSAKLLPLLGIARSQDGSERVLIAHTASDIKAYRINLSAAGDGLVEGIEPPSGTQLLWGDMHGSPEFFEKVGVPDQLSGGGIWGLWDARKFGTIFLYYVRLEQDFEVEKKVLDAQKQVVKPEFILKNRIGYIDFRNPLDKNGAILWSSPRLSGVIYDIIVQDVKSDMRGILVLTSDSASGKGRSLYFFALD